ncbi:hypothetical protein [Psychrobacillus sp. OK032]|uniref:hypothetical protein n=1 Tax=Psychrobacillus sp. OK032 TaxID=1884358 RepID=UPI0008BE26EC|nr:hypothetical protein [Psychrobacillus sp. OK032]SES04113.1 hypothetical protein SAMN05518872_103375 [Psychrobacillus sp. OK032]
MKKVIKIAASTAVAASAFVAAAPANQADAATNVNQLATDAQNAGTVLKWAISVEGSADYKTAPHAQYNAAKKAIAAAEAAAAKLSTSEKLNIDAKLVEPKLQVKRAQAYIDAITSSEKIQDLTSGLDAAIKTNDIEKVEAAYHKATAEYRKQAALLDRVYGQSTRDGIRNEVKPAIEKLVASVKNEVTVNMLAKAAAADVKAGKTADASKKVAEAQAILDANVLTWETSLQKSVDDVVTALPLTVSSVARVNDTTVVAYLSKPVSAVYASDFTFDNGLVATSAKLGTDNKTVTVTTTKQAEGKTYNVSFKGSSASFSTAAATPGNIAISSDDIHSELGRTEVVVATFKKDDGTPNRLPVKVTIPTGVVVTSVNGQLLEVAGTPTPATGVQNFTPNESGQLILVVTNAASATAVVEKVIDFDQNGEKESSQKLNFYTVTDAQPNTTTGVVSYVDAANNFFVAGNNKFKLKAIDTLQLEGSPTNLDAFKSKLSKGDIVTGDYKAGTASSVLNLYYDKPAGFDLEVNEKVLTDTTAIRVDNDYARFTGKGEVGKKVVVYNNATNAKVGETTVGSNGTWTVEVPVAAASTFAFYHHTEAAQPVPATKPATATTLRAVTPGEFTASNNTGSFAAAGGSADQSLNGDTLKLSVATVAGDKFKVASNASITLRDGDGSVVTLVNGQENTKIAYNSSTGKLDITFGYAAAVGGTTGGLQGGLSITDIQGVTNDYGLKLKTKGLSNIAGY